ncbi:2-hydroxyacylsphingosine 1-beta-galactosyltransferase-like isoform X2 [Carcharodon carcharias]|uniref:2-hydroxyacylsphingosine 1-beta-galactosyltransferase-like isoform X2 n=1 Tax=Carcharodon carcharias TaxID=13397 RepID=UPI001B7E0679|nr:2-hydroxyacylsphingosine 1-beta-galactosyltransferase-like isoform X2 [Carcharodon carcharias]
MKVFFTLLLFILTLANLKPSTAAKIMVIPPIMFESHLQIFKMLAKALHGQGHEVVIVVSRGREIEESPYYRFQQYSGMFTTQTADDFLQEKMKNIFSGKLTALELFGILDRYAANCDHMVGNRDLEDRLRQEKFDLLLVDPNEMCGYIFAEILGVKHVTFSTGLWFPAELGAPSPVSYVPEFNSLMTDRMNLLERAWNSLIYIVSRIGTRCVILPKYDAILEKHSMKPSRSMLELVQGSSMFLLCTDIALEFPRPSLPSIVFVGGILTRRANPLPEGLTTWVEDAPEGVVVVSFGAGVKYLSDNLTEKLATAFARLPYKVLWRYKKQAMYLSKLHQDQTLHPVNRTIYWLDYVLRHDGAAHLRPTLYDMFFYQYYMLDVVAVFIVCAILLCYCFLKMMRKLKGSVLPKVKSSHHQNGFQNRKIVSESKKWK